MARLNCFEDFRRAARRRCARMAFDYVDGGAGNESGLRLNSSAFDAVRLVPRALINVESVSLTRKLFATEWALPFGVAPIGLANMLWPNMDTMLARAARDAGIPYTASTPSSTALEALRSVAGDNGWFQLYVGQSQEIVDDLIQRADHAGYTTLVVTVDVPGPGRRVRDMRNGFSVPFRYGPRQIVDLMTHPAWSLATLQAGAPGFANFVPYAAHGAGTEDLARFIARQSSGRLDWALLKQIRAVWPHRLIVKGLLAADDARRAAESGADAIVVSNHGGRQLGSAPATITMLPAVRAAVGPDFPVLLDSGITGGEDIIKALALGADFVLCAKAFLFAGAADGPAGVRHLIDMFSDELTRTMRQLGVTALDQVTADCVITSGDSARRDQPTA